ncbi:MAG: DoxX family protein [Tannerellaceae bacterium]|jgi:uncharacterized membrane protein YphA (DoxX/SURF4 family)|nr:DoxX family protein [Tannerellaceae bacterium]
MKITGSGMKAVIRTVQALLGIVLLFSGFVKAVDPVGGGIKVAEYLAAFRFGGSETSEILSLLLGGALCTGEFILGGCLLFGVCRRLSAWAALAFMSVMTLVTLYLVIANPVTDCGCFGDAIHLTNGQTFGKNIVLTVMAVALCLRNADGYRIFAPRRQPAFIILLSLSVILFTVRNYRHLPPIDFRPFKVGADLRALTLTPPDALPDEYDYTFVYSKDGHERRFTLSDAPMADTAWTFVSAETRLVREGYRPPVAGFVLHDDAGVDVTEAILADTAYLYLLVIPSVETADDGNVEVLNALYGQASLHNIPFYALTASPPTAIARWRDRTAADYPFLTADATILRTIVRANPAVLLLRDARILAKWHPIDIPSLNNLP